MIGFLNDPTTGLGPSIAAIGVETGIRLTPIPSNHVIDQNVPVAIAEKSAAVKYPVIHVYCDRTRNLLTEKFRTFSGKIRTIAEVRVSHDRIEGIEDLLRLYVDAVTQVLDANRGTWGQGAFYTGGYEVTYEPMQHGGRNLLQIAKVTFEVDLSA
jgi:hypothetical protein